MRIDQKIPFLRVALIAGLALAPTLQLIAQTFTTLQTFTPDTDGANPRAGLVLSGQRLYGTTSQGGSLGNGTIFSVGVDGSGYTNLHEFSALSFPDYTNSDGANPYSPLVISGNTLYGTTLGGGSPGYGTVYKMNLDGTGFTSLHHFASTDGAGPYSGLFLSGTSLYGTTRTGSSLGGGIVFSLQADGTGFTTIYRFTQGNDGGAPYAGVIVSGDTIYGSAYDYGGSDHGTLFAVNTNGMGFTLLHTFTAIDGGTGTNRDGVGPYASLLLSGTNLYGTAIGGGFFGYGTVFAVGTNGAGFTNLHSFTGGSDGANPYAGLFLSGTTLYGVARNGGGAGYGTIFALRIDGTGFTNLHTFTGVIDGGNPQGQLVVTGDTLYGTTYGGGITGYGTAFSLVLPSPRLTVTLVETNAVLSWPTDSPGVASGFSLQSSTNLVSPATNWTAVIPGPAVVDTQNVVTNPVSGPRKFYRLIR